MLTATFRDSIGTYTIEDVVNIQYDARDKTYSVMHSDYSTEEAVGQHGEVNAENY